MLILKGAGELDSLLMMLILPCNWVSTTSACGKPAPYLPCLLFDASERSFNVIDFCSFSSPIPTPSSMHKHCLVPVLNIQMTCVAPQSNELSIFSLNESLTLNPSSIILRSVPAISIFDMVFKGLVWFGFSS